MTIGDAGDLLGEVIRAGTDATAALGQQLSEGNVTTIMVLGTLAISLLAVALAEMARRDTRREASVIAADVTRAAAARDEARNCVSAARTYTATCQEHAGTCAEAARNTEASAERAAVPLAAALLRAGAESLEAAEAAARE